MGERISALSQELNVLRKDLYAWRDLFRAGGEQAPRPTGRPKSDAVAPSVKERARDVTAVDPGAPSALPNSGARSSSSRLNGILFGKPCGGSRKHAGRAPGLA
ncbi:hypothetical protein I6F16_34290 [Bradyrhizobium sp. IC4060]|nr:hypothetical protein [Bradyrhizobium sp. IC4060]MCA1487730.1 hypothetical protein [Bradyrhizobium sp. IC4061]